MTHFPTFKNYTWKEWLTLLLASAAIVYAICSILLFASLSETSRSSFFEKTLVKSILISWSCGPPAWFFVEYYILWTEANAEKKDKLKIGRELATPFWAAVLATLLFLIPK